MFLQEKDREVVPPRAVLALLISLLLTSLLVVPSTEVEAASVTSLKRTFMLGLHNQPHEIGWMKNSGSPWDARYQYLNGDVTLNNGWVSWEQPAGAFAANYMANSAANGYIPVLTYYMMVNASPGKYKPTEKEKSLTNLRTPATMKAYFTNFRLLMTKAREFNRPVIVHVEPDFWGFMQTAAPGDNPAAIWAAVNSSGFGGAAAGKPDNLAGFAQTLVAIRNNNAPNVVLAWHVSAWSTGPDVSTNTDPYLNLSSVINRTALFYNRLGAKFDLLFFDPSDRDAGYYAPYDNANWRHWWDISNVRLPNFERFRRYLQGVTTQTGLKAMLWQLPIGNRFFRAMNNTSRHYQDNRVEYFLGANYRTNLQAWINSGLIGILFGDGQPDQTSYLDRGDGVTNPLPINGNTVITNLADDDGGYLRNRAANYYRNGALPLP